MEALSSSLSMLSTKGPLGEADRIAYVPGCPRPQPRLELTSWGFCRVSTNMGIYDLGYFFASFDFFKFLFYLGVSWM